MANLRVINAICYFCKGFGDTRLGKIVRCKGGGKAFKCGRCLEDDEKFQNDKKD